MDPASMDEGEFRSEFPELAKENEYEDEIEVITEFIEWLYHEDESAITFRAEEEGGRQQIAKDKAFEHFGINPMELEKRSQKLPRTHPRITTGRVNTE